MHMNEIRAKVSQEKELVNALIGFSFVVLFAIVFTLTLSFI